MEQLSPQTSACYVLVDCSGSMAELGKQFLMLNLVRTIRQRQGFATDSLPCQIMVWQKKLYSLDVIEEQDIALPVPYETADTAALLEFCRQLNVSGGGRILLLSDGLSLNKEWIKALTLYDKVSFETLAVGADADHLNLDRLSTCGVTGDAEDILQVVGRFLSPHTRVHKMTIDSIDPQWEFPSKPSSPSISCVPSAIENDDEDDW